MLETLDNHLGHGGQSTIEGIEALLGFYLYTGKHSKTALRQIIEGVLKQYDEDGFLIERKAEA